MDLLVSAGVFCEQMLLFSSNGQVIVGRDKNEWWKAGGDQTVVDDQGRGKLHSVVAAKVMTLGQVNCSIYGRSF